MKNILFAVCGLSPQVITEAFYALHQEGRRVDAIRVITTRSGKDIINAMLLSPVDGRYHQYLRDYGLDAGQIDFHAGHICTITDENGREIDDIADENDNERFLKKCLELTFTLTNDPETAVFFLVAGGRKTMSSCLTVAAQMYGRRQDRIYHVLVSPEFESNRDFFYPPSVPIEIELQDQKGQTYVKSTRYAEINLISMPFVSIRERLSGERLKAPQDPATLLLSVVREPKPVLTVNIPDKKLIYKETELDLPPALLAIYAFFAMQKKDCRLEKTSCRSCHDCFLSIQDIFASQDKITELYRRMVGNDRFLSGRRNNYLGNIGKMEAEDFHQYKAKITKRIKHVFGLYALPKLAVTSIGQRPDTKYGIVLDKGRIRVTL